MKWLPVNAIVSAGGKAAPIAREQRGSREAEGASHG